MGGNPDASHFVTRRLLDRGMGLIRVQALSYLGSGVHLLVPADPPVGATNRLPVTGSLRKKTPPLSPDL